VLGGMLLSKDAIADVVEVLRGVDFYRPAHELVFEAILDLYAEVAGRGPGAPTADIPGPGLFSRAWSRVAAMAR